MTKNLIQNGQSLLKAQYASGIEIPTYDDGLGPLWVSRNSIAINGIVRAQTWEDAYSTCEDEFFLEADESIEDLVRKYGFSRTHKKVVRDPSVTVATDICAVGERLEIYPDDYPNGKLAPKFIRWVVIETPNADAWTENQLFQEAYGFRPNGPNGRDTRNHGIYRRDLNGDALDRLTSEMLEDWGIQLEIEP